MTKSQRGFIKWFREYHIDDDEPNLPERKTAISTEDYMKRFNPAENAIDRRILYEITKRKYPGEHFSDSESDDEGQNDEMLDQREELTQNIIRRKSNTRKEGQQYSLNDWEPLKSIYIL